MASGQRCGPSRGNSNWLHRHAFGSYEWSRELYDGEYYACQFIVKSFTFGFVEGGFVSVLLRPMSSQRLNFVVFVTYTLNLTTRCI